MIRLQPFQDRFLSNAFKRGVRLAILCVPRGQGKSSLMAWILAQCLNPESDMFIGRGADLVLVAGSIEQAGYCFKPLRNQLEELDAKGYSFTDSSRSLGVRHKASNARLRVISSNANRSLGLGATTKLVVADECSSWNAREGQSMFNALTTSQGKPGNESMRIICISTLAPAFNPEHWFRRLVAEGTDMQAGRYVQQISGNLKKWKSRAELKRCNPLSEVFPESLKILERELAEAKTDPAKEAVYKQFRLNIPVADESEVLLSSQQFQVMAERETAECHDWESLIFGVDLGGSRSWSSVVCIGTESLRVRCLALTGGFPQSPTRKSATAWRRASTRAWLMADCCTGHRASGIRAFTSCLIWPLPDSASLRQLYATVSGCTNSRMWLPGSIRSLPGQAAGARPAKTYGQRGSLPLMTC